MTATGYTHFSIDALDNQYASLPKYQENETTLPLPPESVAGENSMRPILPPARQYETEESSVPSRPGHAEYTKKKQKGRKRKLKHKNTGPSGLDMDFVNPSIYQGDSIPAAPPEMIGPSKIPTSGSVFNAYNHPNYNRTTRSQGAIPSLMSSRSYQVQGHITTPQTARSAPASILRPTTNFGTSYHMPFGRYMVPSRIQQSLMSDSRQLLSPVKQTEDHKHIGKSNVSNEKTSSAFNACYRSMLILVICLFIASIVVAAVFAAMPI